MTLVMNPLIGHRYTGRLVHSFTMRQRLTNPYYPSYFNLIFDITIHHFKHPKVDCKRKMPLICKVSLRKKFPLSIFENGKGCITCMFCDYTRDMKQHLGSFIEHVRKHFLKIFADNQDITLRSIIKCIKPSKAIVLGQNNPYNMTYLSNNLLAKTKYVHHKNMLLKRDNRIMLQRYLARTELKENIQCPFCDVMLRYGGRCLHQHILVFHYKQVSCKDCPATFVSFRSFALHKRRHNRKKFSSCDVCRNGDRDSIPCPTSYCRYRSLTVDQMREHIRSWHFNIAACSKCLQIFPRKYDLFRHVTRCKKQGETPTKLLNVCDICFKRFPNSLLLSQHAPVHPANHGLSVRR